MKRLCCGDDKLIKNYEYYTLLKYSFTFIFLDVKYFIPCQINKNIKVLQKFNSTKIEMIIALKKKIEFIKNPRLQLHQLLLVILIHTVILLCRYNVSLSIS